MDEPADAGGPDPAWDLGLPEELLTLPATPLPQQAEAQQPQRRDSDAPTNQPPTKRPRGRPPGTFGSRETRALLRELKKTAAQSSDSAVVPFSDAGPGDPRVACASSSSADGIAYARSFLQPPEAARSESAVQTLFDNTMGVGTPLQLEIVAAARSAMEGPRCELDNERLELAKDFCFVVCFNQESVVGPIQIASDMWLEKNMSAPNILRCAESN